MANRDDIEAVLAAAIKGTCADSLFHASLDWNGFKYEYPKTHKAMIDAAVAEAERLGLMGTQPKITRLQPRKIQDGCCNCHDPIDGDDWFCQSCRDEYRAKFVRLP